MQFSGIIALLVAMLVSRFINERGYRTLEPDQKLRLMDGFSSTRMVSMIPLLVMIIIFWFLMTNTNIDKRLLAISTSVLVLVYILIRTILNYRKLITLDMPNEYRRYFMLAQIITLVGVSWFFAGLF